MKRTRLILSLSIIFLSFFNNGCREHKEVAHTDQSEHLWRGWNKYQIPQNDSMARYGRELIENTSYYLGPKGLVAQISNGMNCQNCHLDGGTVPWGNNYGAVAATYPRFRNRSGGLEDIPKRVNDCFQRSLNGSSIAENSKEMLAIMAYIKWLGDDVPKGHTPKGSGIQDLPFLDRAADPVRGKIVYTTNCQRCHGTEGQGLKEDWQVSYTYPPLWGKNSFTTAAGLYRISRFAGYVKNNMPNDLASYDNPQLSDEDAWDVAAYVNSQPRPIKIFKEDWPDISKKPVDHPFGPYHDGFSEEQHKYGPFKPILQRRGELKKMQVIKLPASKQL